MYFTLMLNGIVMKTSLGILAHFGECNDFFVDVTFQAPLRGRSAVPPSNT